MKLYSVVGQWTDNTMAIAKHPKKTVAQFADFENAKKYRDHLRKINNDTVSFYIMESNMDETGYFESMRLLASDVPFNIGAF